MDIIIEHEQLPEISCHPITFGDKTNDVIGMGDNLAIRLNSRYRSAWLSATQTMGSFTSFLANTLSCLLWLGITILQGMAYIFYINDIRFAYLAGLVGFHVLHIQPFTEPVAVHLITGNNDE